MIGSDFVSTTATTYQWYYNGGIITGATNQSYTPTQNGTYTVEITDTSGCSAIAENYNLVNVGISAIENEGFFSISPNPANEILSIKFPLQNTKTASRYMVYNTIGQMLMNGSFAKEETIINISSLAKGLYILKVQNNESLGVMRFVKE